MNRFTFFFFLCLSVNIYSQNKPVYPLPINGFKRVDLLLPKIDNTENFKVEVKFSFEAEIIECADADFSIYTSDLKAKYGIPNSQRYPYYEIAKGAGDLSEGITSDCKSKNKVKKKIFSSQSINIEYQSYYPIPFYIPNGWSLEYRVWKASEKFTNVN